MGRVEAGLTVPSKLYFVHRAIYHHDPSGTCVQYPRQTALVILRKGSHDTETSCQISGVHWHVGFSVYHGP